MPSTCLKSQVAVPPWAWKPCVQVLGANFPEFELNAQHLSFRLCILIGFWSQPFLTRLPCQEDIKLVLYQHTAHYAAINPLCPDVWQSAKWCSQKNCMSCLEFQCQASEHFMPITCFPPNITVGAQDQAIHVWPLITHSMTSTVLAAMEKAKKTWTSLYWGSCRMTSLSRSPGSAMGTWPHTWGQCVCVSVHGAHQWQVTVI